VSVNIWGSAFYSGHLVEDGPAIAERQGLAAPASDADAIPRPAPRFEPDKVIADVMKLVFHPFGSRFADTDDADKRTDARNDAKHGQDAPDFVPEQSLEGFPHDCIEEHFWSR
jgi:hypothetical protein